MLHRKFFIPSKSGASWQYPYSVKACVDSAMRILHSQSLIYDNSTTPVLAGHRWKDSSLITYDFFLAAMLICVYLSHDLDENRSPEYDGQSVIRITWTKEEMTKALYDMKKIWDRLTPISREAAKAAKALNKILKKVESRDVVSQSTTASSTGSADTEMSMLMNRGHGKSPIPKLSNDKKLTLAFRLQLSIL